MENYPFHFCPNCGRHQSLTTRKPDIVVCFSCEYRNYHPAKALFGRAEWDACQRPELMLLCVRGLGFPTTPRKKRFVMCGTVRAYFPTCRDPLFLEGLAWAEEWADTGTEPDGAGALYDHLLRNRTAEDGSVWPTFVAACLRGPLEETWWKPPDVDDDTANAVRELFCNPFRAFVWNPQWFTTTARDLASHICESQDFSAMPILADALQDAGCENEHILSHCRESAKHLRGCWVLDAILGKS